MKRKMIKNFEMIEPGTRFREGLDNILDGGKGALIIVGLDEEVEQIIDGGFYLNCDYTPERLFELSKMDGAIILDDEITRIIYANVHLQPDSIYETSESGTRHRTAERAAKQLDRLTIAISERKKVMTIYNGEERYKLKSLMEVSTEASQALNTLERYRKVLDKSLGSLTILELDDMVTVEDVCIVVQKFEMLNRVRKEAYAYILELGSDGMLINLQYEDLLKGTEEEEFDFLSDYYLKGEEDEDIEQLKYEISELSDNEMLDLVKISGILGFGKSTSKLDNRINPKGYRILSKFGKLTSKDVEALIEKFEDLITIQEASIEEIVETKVVSKFKANAIKRGFERLKFTAELARI